MGGEGGGVFGGEWDYGVWRDDLVGKNVEEGEVL